MHPIEYVGEMPGGLQPVRLQRSGGLRPSELRRITRTVVDNETLFMEAWRERFDT